MSLSFSTKIEQFSFDENGIKDLKVNSVHGEDWPVVYILSGEKEAYVGETQSAFDRMNQHIKNTKRNNLTKINLMSSDSFNKSAILDIENMLITHMHADNKFVLQNANGGQSKLHNYYQRSEYQNLFGDIWKKLKKLNLVTHELFEVENSEIFKFSPYKELTGEQYNVVEELLERYSSVINGNSKRNVIVNGGAGTGKSLIAIYFINMIANIIKNNYDVTDTDDYVDGESLYNRAELIKSISKHKNVKIAFVIAVPSFKDTVKKVFRSIKELRNIDVISPSEVTKDDYDVLIVDEAHRLKRRAKLTNYGAYDAVNKELNLPSDSTELDWLSLKAKKLLVLFYDEKQSVKESDVRKEDFDKILKQDNTDRFDLKAQLRVKGGNEYIKFINDLFSNNPSNYKLTSGYDLKIYDDCFEMFNDIKSKNKKYDGLCRMLSGISFFWRKKVRDKSTIVYEQDYDFEIDGHHYCWNDDFNATNFITNDKYLDRIGCIYTCQGHDLNYAGIIFGNDISFNPTTKKIEYHPDKFSDTNSKSTDVTRTIQNIINAYKVLLTRGVYGTYIYAVDNNLRDYLDILIKKKE